jgi:hypothetical protein
MTLSVMPCPIVDFPIHYLCAPLSTSYLPKSQYIPLIEKVAAKVPAWQGPPMNKSDHLTLVKSTISIMPIYLMMSYSLPNWVVKEIDKICRNFLWTRTDSVVSGEMWLLGQLFSI